MTSRQKNLFLWEEAEPQRMGAGTRALSAVKADGALQCSEECLVQHMNQTMPQPNCSTPLHSTLL